MLSRFPGRLQLCAAVHGLVARAGESEGVPTVLCARPRRAALVPRRLARGPAAAPRPRALPLAAGVLTHATTHGRAGGHVERLGMVFAESKNVRFDKIVVCSLIAFGELVNMCN